MKLFYQIGLTLGTAQRNFLDGYAAGRHPKTATVAVSRQMAPDREVSDVAPTHMDSHAADVLDQQILGYFKGDNPNKVAAIKWHRNMTKASLKYSKEYVERLMERNGIVYVPVWNHS